MENELRKAALDVLDKWMVQEKPSSPVRELANHAILLASAYLEDHAVHDSGEIEDLKKMVSELDEAGFLEGSDIGEWWIALSGLLSLSNDFGTPEFVRAIQDEIRIEHARLRRDYRIEAYIEKNVQAKRRLVYAPE